MNWTQFVPQRKSTERKKSFIKQILNYCTVFKFNHHNVSLSYSYSLSYCKSNKPGLRFSFFENKKDSKCSLFMNIRSEKINKYLHYWKVRGWLDFLLFFCIWTERICLVWIAFSKEFIYLFAEINFGQGCKLFPNYLRTLSNLTILASDLIIHNWLLLIYFCYLDSQQEEIISLNEQQNLNRCQLILKFIFQWPLNIYIY